MLGSQRLPAWLVRLYRALDRDDGMLRLIAVMRLGALLSLVFYFLSPLEHPTPDDREALVIIALVCFGLFAALAAVLAWRHSKRLLTLGGKVLPIVGDVLFITAFYWLSGNARADIYLLYLLPLFTAVRYLRVPWAALLLIFTCLCFSIILAILSYAPSDYPPPPQFLRTLLARNAVLIGLTFLQALRWPFSILQDAQDAQRLEAELAFSADQVKELARERQRWLETITELGQRLAGLVNIELLYAFVVEETKRRLSAEACTLFLLNEQTNLLERTATAGVNSNWLPNEKYRIGEGIVGSTLGKSSSMTDSRPIRTVKADEHPGVDMVILRAYEHELRSGQVKHACTAPLNNGQARSFGVLRVLNKLEPDGTLTPGGFSQEDEDFLVTIAAMVAIAVENTRLHDQTTRYFEEFKAVHEASQAVVSAQKLTDVLQTIVSLAGRVAGSTHTGVVLADEEGVLIDSVEDGPAATPLHKRARVNGATHRIIRSRQPLFCTDTGCEPEEHNPLILQRGIKSYAGLPIIGRTKVHGVLFVHSEQPDAFSSNAQLLQTFCNHAATALDNADTFERLDEVARRNARGRLSEDLHDCMNFLHGALVLGTSYQRDLLEEDEREGAVENAKRLSKAALHTYRSLRELLQDVRDPVLEAHGLRVALQRYARLLTQTTVEFHFNTATRLNKDVEHTVYKIAREALHNALKHSNQNDGSQEAIKIGVDFTVYAGRYTLSVRDNGPGFSPESVLAKGDAFGLQAMQRWAYEINAELNFESAPGQGARVTMCGLCDEGDSTCLGVVQE